MTHLNSTINSLSLTRLSCYTETSLFDSTTPTLAGWIRDDRGFMLIVLIVSQLFLFSSAGLWATSYSSETYAILYALEWYILHP